MLFRSGIAHAGDSLAWNYQGELLTDLGQEDSMTTVTLEKASLESYRAQFPAHLDADHYTLADT